MTDVEFVELVMGFVCFAQILVIAFQSFDYAVVL